MRIMGQAAERGDEKMHSDTLEPGDTDWATYQSDDTWRDFSALVEKAMRMRAIAVPEAPPPTPEQEAAERQAFLSRHGIFWDDMPMEASTPMKVTTLPAPKPHPLDWPPGLAGEIAQFVYRSAPRPVKEVAVVAALGLLAGVCGRQWYIRNSGLNLYIILVARSAIGKEGMHSGISALLAACTRSLPSAHQFVDFMDYASGPALTKACLSSPCFVNVRGEIGRKLKAMSKAKPGDAMDTLRTRMTELYTKSGPGAVAGGIGYSNTESNVASVMSVSYSMIGETTPGTFLESLTSEMMEDGFMSRLCVIEYDGPRPDEHLSPLDAPPQALVQQLVCLMGQADLSRAKNSVQMVQRELGAGVKLDLFKRECDRRINSHTDESRRQMWNRAHLKVLRIAALLAVADSLGNRVPVITQAHADWAINLILRDIWAFSKRLNGGDVGSGDDARLGKLASILREYMLNPVPASYKVSEAMQRANIVPHNYLLLRANRAAAYYNHRFGASRALTDTISEMLSSGYLIEVPKDRVADAYNYHGKAYRILRLPDMDA